MTYSNDTTAAQTSANLSQGRHFLAGVSEGLTKGYFAGGFTGGASGQQATADKITYSNDTTSAVTTANITTGRIYAAGSSQEYSSAFNNSSVILI